MPHTARKRRKIERKEATAEPRQPHADRVSAFHALNKALARAADAKERQTIQAKLTALGGLAEYQRSSLHGADPKQGGADTAKWLVDVLKQETTAYPVRLLDVGAIDGKAYDRWRDETEGFWMDVTSIDLNSQAICVRKLDFLDYPLDDDPLDAVALCLVVNFEGSLTRRGEMLVHAARLLKPGGLLYLVLPAPCLNNSRYMDHGRLLAILDDCGFDEHSSFDTAKLSVFFLRRRDELPTPIPRWKKQEIRGGVERNNFCINLTM